MLKRKTCAKCKNRSKCTGTEDCPEKIEEILKRNTASRKERFLAELKTKKGVRLDENAQTDTVEFHKPRGIILNDKQMRKLRQHVDKAILSTHKKQKRWFYAYLRCKTLREIAAVANCTAENVRKQIQKAVNNVFVSMSKETKNTETNLSLTPKKFKDSVILYT